MSTQEALSSLGEVMHDFSNEQLRLVIEESNKDSGRVFVILDDDPTGSQTVHDIPVITDWSGESIEWGFKQGVNAFFILTNSRSLSKVDAAKLVNEVVQNVSRVASELKATYSFFMRGDSTLRGHFLQEIEIAKKAKGLESSRKQIVIFAPAYFEAGRITRDDTQLVRQNDTWVPVSETDYSLDSIFGYKSSNLQDYVKEKSVGSKSIKTQSLALDSIRNQSPREIAEGFINASPETMFIINAEESRDLAIVSLAATIAESAGIEIIYMGAPSLVSVRIANSHRDPLVARELFLKGSREGHGLIVVGSHVSLTSIQVLKLRELLPAKNFVELEIQPLLDDQSRENEITRCIGELKKILLSDDAVLITSREEIKGSGNLSLISISQTIANSIVEISNGVLEESQISWILAKGGITSNDILTKVARMKRATVLGQLFSGIVSVWAPSSESKNEYNNFPVIVFAGNVGLQDSLKDAVTIMREAQK